MAALIQVLDYGSGNLFSIKDALGRVSPDIKVKISSRYRGGVDGLVLPGVGSFSSAQKILGENKETILGDTRNKKLPLLGICLGMQLMFDRSEEGKGMGLSLFKGKVVKFRSEPNLKIPHMGWNTLKLTRSKSPFCQGLTSEEWVYFVHSFYPSPQDEGIVMAWTNYGNQKFPAIIESGNIFGTQFHPEKSSKAGFRLISNFTKKVLTYSK